MSFDQVQSTAQVLLSRSFACQERLAVIQANISKISIFRPIRAFRVLRAISRERDGVSPDVAAVVDGLAKIVFITPDKTMGETLSSCLDTLRLSSQMMRLQTQWIEVDSALQQTAAFSFAIFALYVSVVSLLATLILGLLPFFL